jgi:hypothetical protein
MIVRRAAKYLGFVLIIALILMAGDIIFVEAREYYIYCFRTEEKAEAAAHGLFLKICSRENLPQREIGSKFVRRT